MTLRFYTTYVGLPGKGKWGRSFFSFLLSTYELRAMSYEPRVWHFVGKQMRLLGESRNSYLEIEFYLSGNQACGLRLAACGYSTNTNPAQ